MSTESGNSIKIKYIPIIGLIFFIIAAICSDGYLHPDEHFQLLEFANYKMGGIRPEYLPWEFDEQMRPTFQVGIAYLLCISMKGAGIFDPFIAAMILRLITGVLMFYVLYLFYNRYKVEIGTKGGLYWVTALSFLLWYIPYISVRYSSESFGTIFMLLAVILYHVPKHKKLKTGHFILIGLVLGISFISRFQMGFMIFGFGCWVLFMNREKIKPMLIMLGGFAIGIGIGQLCDYWFYGTWVSSAYNYFYQNLVENKAAGFGVSPFWYYASLTPLFVFPLFGIIVVPAFIAFFIKKPRHIFTWLLVPFLLIHHVIGHKELRFLFAVTPFIPFIIVMVFENIKWLKHIRFLKYLFWAINIPALIIMSVKPAYDNMEVFKYLYRHPSKSQVYYLKQYVPFMMYHYKLVNRPFTKGKDLQMTFFYRPDLDPHPLDDTTLLIEQAKTSDQPVLFVVRTTQYDRIYKTQFEQAGLQQKIVYETYHRWLMPINYSDWISQEDVGSWTIVELSIPDR
jgi:phosphatidylinositol glycan class B